MAAALVDAGAFVALFDEADRHYEHYRAVFAALLRKGSRLVTTWPCVTEASYLLAPRSHMAMLRWLASGAVTVQAFDASDLDGMVEAMARYSEPRKTIMDFADATLLWLATRLDSNIVLSVDRRDFERYRLPDGRAFEVL